MKIKKLLTAALLLMITFCWGQTVHDLFATNFISFTVPQSYEGQISYLNSNDLIEKKSVHDVKHDRTLLPSFPNLVSNVTLYEENGNGVLSLIGNSLSVNNKSYTVIYDYTQTQTILINDASTNVNYYALIGISVRMVAKIVSKSSGINLANLYGLSLAADKKKIAGSLEVRVNGISSQQINALVPVTTDLSSSSIANALQAFATVKSHIYDAETKITPQFLAFSVIGNDKNKDIDINKLSEKVRSFTF
ncbi:hypothetical protein [Chryseobacterium sp. Mn2064]|uniref:hypothetical protein n=1 Tax=Chryseobacterium sp. Mn2064 TaxID=3395263 RepID=UPI003BD36495